MVADIARWQALCAMGFSSGAKGTRWLSSDMRSFDLATYSRVMNAEVFSGQRAGDGLKIDRSAASSGHAHPNLSLAFIYSLLPERISDF